MTKLSFSVRLGGFCLWLCLSFCHSTTVCPREEVCNEVCWNSLVDTLEGFEETPSEVQAQLHRLLETENIFFGSDSCSRAISGFGYIRAGFKHLESLRSAVSSKPEVFTGFAALVSCICLSWAVVVMCGNGAGSRSRSPPPLESVLYKNDNPKQDWGSIPLLPSFPFDFGWSPTDGSKVVTHFFP